MFLSVFVHQLCKFFRSFWKGGAIGFAALEILCEFIYNQQALCGHSWLFYIALIKFITAFRAEFGRILRIFRLPAAFITAVQWLRSRFFRAAFRAEPTLIYSTAVGTAPAIGRLGGTAL